MKSFTFLLGKLYLLSLIKGLWLRLDFNLLNLVTLFSQIDHVGCWGLYDGGRWIEARMVIYRCWGWWYVPQASQTVLKLPFLLPWSLLSWYKLFEMAFFLFLLNCSECPASASSDSSSMEERTVASSPRTHVFCHNFILNHGRKDDDSQVRFDLTDDVLHVVHTHTLAFFLFFSSSPFVFRFFLSFLFAFRCSRSWNTSTSVALLWYVVSGELPVLMRIFGGSWNLKIWVFLSTNVSFFFHS